MKFIDFFSGIGGFHSGLESIGMECVGWCEFDKFAQKSYRAMYNTEGLWFSDDVRNVSGDELPVADIWTFGFPCQDISVAGKQLGIKQGTRSGLFYEIVRLLNETKENKPQWLIIENVKNLLSIGRGFGFVNVLDSLAEAGYDTEWAVYNSKNYGVPQNRERVYIIGYLRGTCSNKILPIPRQSDTSLKELTSKQSQGTRIYDSKGISRCLAANGGGLGAKTGLYAFNVKACLTPDRVLKRQNGRRFKENGEPSFTLTATDRHGVLFEYDTGETVKAYIRKLTPRECFRLQGFTDEQFDKARAVNSDSQLYKQAGNAVTVNVVREIGKSILNYYNSQVA